MDGVNANYPLVDMTDQLLDQIAEALSDSGSFGTWFFDRSQVQVDIRTEDSEFDDHDGDEDDLVEIGSVSSREWYLDMADFAAGIDNAGASRALERALEGRGAFRRFKDVLHTQYEDLVPLWNTLSAIRGRRRAVEWLMDEGLVNRTAAQRRLDELQDPELKTVGSQSDSSSTRHVTVVNGKGDLAYDLPMLLRRVADEIEGQEINLDQLLDVVIGRGEVTELGAPWRATVYWSSEEA